MSLLQYIEAHPWWTFVYLVVIAAGLGSFRIVRIK